MHLNNSRESVASKSVPLDKNTQNTHSPNVSAFCLGCRGFMRYCINFFFTSCYACSSFYWLVRVERLLRKVKGVNRVYHTVLKHCLLSALCNRTHKCIALVDFTVPFAQLYLWFKKKSLNATVLKMHWSGF